MSTNPSSLVCAKRGICQKKPDCTDHYCPGREQAIQAERARRHAPYQRLMHTANGGQVVDTTPPTPQPSPQARSQRQPSTPRPTADHMAHARWVEVELAEAKRFMMGLAIGISTFFVAGFVIAACLAYPDQALAALRATLTRLGLS